jgi:protein-tyrosine kinase
MSRVEEALRRSRGEGRGAAPAMRLPRVTFEAYPSEISGSPDSPTVNGSNHRESRATAAADTAGFARVIGLSASVEGKIVGGTETLPGAVEEYRRLAAALHLMQLQSRLKKLMISSALPRDGKTLTGTNLALTLAESYKRRVLLIDADLRHPTIHEIFGLSLTGGLSAALRADMKGPLPVIEMTPNLAILPAGPPNSSPVAGLVSERMRAIVAEAAERFDWVILDTPPAGLLSDANLLAALVDGVLLVVGAGTTHYAAVKRAVLEFGRERILGVVLNRVVDYERSNRYFDTYCQSPSSGTVAESGS